MEFCSNCDVAVATCKCLECPVSDSKFCDSCASLHTKVKAYRGHSIEELRKQPVFCGNCEKSEAKFLCRQCDESCKYLCLGCCVMHPKIKAFRGHNVVSMQSSEKAGVELDFQMPTSLAGASDALAKAIDIVYFNLSTSTWSEARFWQTLGAVLLVSASYYLIIRTVFTKYSSIVNIAMAIALYQWFQTTKYKASSAEQSLLTGKADPLERASSVSKSMHSSGASGMHSSSAASAGGRAPRGWNVSLDQFDKEQFKGEFWYSLEDKKASLRPRGRPYRRTHQQGAAGATPAAAAVASPTESETPTQGGGQE